MPFLMKCDFCGASITSSHMPRHLGSKKCEGSQKVQATMRPVLERMERLNYVKVEHPGYARTLKKAGVPIERDIIYAGWDNKWGLYTTDGWWAPKWASDIVSNRSMVKYRVAVLKMCLADEEKRDAVHAIMLMDPRDRMDAIKRIYKDWGLKP